MAKIKLSEIKSIIREVLDEMDLGEMARTAGTGGAYAITPEGESILKQAAQSGSVPEGVKVSELMILKWLYQAKKEGKRVQKIDYAKERGVPQPAVNPLFNSLESKGFVGKEGYQSALGSKPATTKSTPDIKTMLGDLDFDI